MQEKSWWQRRVYAFLRHHARWLWPPVDALTVQIVADDQATPVLDRIEAQLVRIARLQDNIQAGVTQIEPDVERLARELVNRGVIR